MYHISVSGQDNGIKEVNSLEFQQMIQEKNGVLLDVRTKSEFSNGHIENAGNLNYYALDFKRKLTLLPQDQPIYLYCTTGYRSEKAAEVLVKNGYANVYNLQHGIMEWESQNLSVIIEPDARPDTDNLLIFMLPGADPVAK
jgi:rhodanese-related sulfurtransferase